MGNNLKLLTCFISDHSASVNTMSITRTKKHGHSANVHPNLVSAQNSLKSAYSFKALLLFIAPNRMALRPHRVASIDRHPSFRAKLRADLDSRHLTILGRDVYASTHHPDTSHQISHHLFRNRPVWSHQISPISLDPMSLAAL